MEVRPGYKQTEVGVIPEDWLVKPIGKVAPLQRGFDLPTRNIRPGPFPIVYSNGIDGFHNVAMASGPGVITGRSGTLGMIHYVEEDYWPHNTSLWVTRFNDNVPKFIYYLYQAVRFQRFASGSGVPTLNRNDAHSHPIALPTNPAEQRAIAAALSDMDALLSGLDRLIAKKRDLKQAAMQQLLTGQTRLPGFHGVWDVKALRQAALISTGINKPISEMGSGALYVTVQDLYDGTSIRTSRLSRIKVSSAEIETRSLTVGDIVFGKSSVKRDGIGYPSQFLGCDEPVVYSGFTYRARAREGTADPTFLFYALRTEQTRRWLIDNSQASALTNINQTIADAIPIMLPPTLPEQSAIAAVLSDMDAELAALEARRYKTRDLKQAMMQELLTGKTRLVPAVATHA